MPAMTPKEYAAVIMGQKPDEAQSQNDATIRQLRQEIAGLKTQMGGVSQSLEKRRDAVALGILAKDLRGRCGSGRCQFVGAGPRVLP